MRLILIALVAVVVGMIVGCAVEGPDTEQIEPNPKLALEYFNRSLGYGKTGESQLAIDDLTKAIQLGVTQRDTDGRNILANAYVNRGTAYRQQGNSESAIADYDKAIQIGSEWDPWAYLLRAGAYGVLGNIAQAEADKAKACLFQQVVSEEVFRPNCD